jgi:N-acyl homoserine lactone hydrolase
VATPVHSPDHLSIFVVRADAAVFIAGDASFSEATMLTGQIDGVSGDEIAASATLAAIRAFAASRPTIYLPAHDPEAAPRLAARRTTEAANRAR